MNAYKLPIHMILLLFGLALQPGVISADQLLMQNGDIISGNIVKVTDGKIVIDPSYGDEYAIDMAEVLSIETDKVFDVSLSDGSEVEAQFAGETQGEQILAIDDGTINVPVTEIAEATESGLEIVVDPWDGTGEFGFVNTTGNTETVALNMRLNFVRTSERWRHRFTGTAMTTSEDGIKDNERYTIEIQSDRKLSDINWLFGAFRWDADKFGTYDPQVSLTAGYGRQLMKSERHELRGEIGAGYRWLTETESGFKSDEPIARFLLDDWWQMFSSTRWTNRLLIEYGSSNTFTQFNTGLSISMTERFAIKLGFEIRNNSNIPPGDSEHTDTITSANLVYDF